MAMSTSATNLPLARELDRGGGVGRSAHDLESGLARQNLREPLLIQTNAGDDEQADHWTNALHQGHGSLRAPRRVD
jgi:hypothetical protein